MGVTRDPYNVIFVDFEASSLHENSWPIEVGLCWFNENKALQSASKLIRPESYWEESGWDEISAEVHGISKAELMVADPAPAVADWVLSMIGEKRLISDCPSYDERWMSTLLSTSTKEHGYAHFEMILHYASEMFSWDVAVELMASMEASNERPHRAGPDALLLGKQWEMAIEWQSKHDNGKFKPVLSADYH